MNKRVLLVYPPSGRLLREDRCQIPAKNIVMSPPVPPMDLLYLAAVAERSGCECRVRDYSVAGRGSADFLRDLESYRPDYLLVSITTPSIEGDMAQIAAAKRVLPGLRTVAKGAHFLVNSEEVLDRYPQLDMAIRGEAELTFGDVVTGKDPASIPGLTWRGAAAIVRNPDRPYLEDLDSLPFPARHLVDNGSFVRPDTGALQTVIKVSRGCPYHCFFCLATPVSGSKARKRSPQNIAAEIVECQEKYGIRNFIFWSDFFTQDKAWVLDLCRAIRGTGLNITWSANTRASAMDEELAREMKNAGCSLVSIGVESGNQQILDRIGKKVSLDEIRKAFAVLRRAKISTLAYYLLGLPWETHATMEETVRFSIELDSDFASFFVATPFPGTRFYDYATAQGLFSDPSGEPSFGSAYHGASVRGHFLSREEIGMWRTRAIRRYLLRPKYIVRMLSRVRSLRELGNYAVAGMQALRNG
ncbi:MAG: radical SAM protein [Nitrospirota bacterium]|nr:radical SAM protein [Nitrospirota bacterium]